MYTEYFGLAENPFSIAPDPRYLYLSEQHREALAHLLYGIAGDGGFVLLTGEVGTGKTTICRCLLEQLPKDCDVAFIFNPKLTVVELLSTICDEFNIGYPPATQSIKVFVDLINQYLLNAHAQSRKALLIIDEAQNLQSDVLEQIRLLTNLETHQRKLLQVILLGQPELRYQLAQPKLRQLAQRVIARYHLGALDRREVAAYVYHRLNVAGSRRPLFPASTLTHLHRLSGGIPRLINVLCDRALLGCYVQGKESVDKATLATAAREVFGKPPSLAERLRKPLPSVFAAVLVLLGGALLLAVYRQVPPLRQKPAPTAAAAGEKSPAITPEFPLTASVPVVKHQLPNRAATDSESAATRPPTNQQPGALPQAVTPVEPAAQNDRPAAATDSKPAVPTQPIATPPEPEPAAPPAQAAAAAVPPDKLDQPADQPLADSRHAAAKALLQLWGAAFTGESSRPLCSQAEAQGLACLAGKGGLADLRRFNRPALLKLYTEEGVEFYATLISLDDRRARFSVDGSERVVPIEELASHWLGDYTLLWRAPPHYRGVMQVGDRGPVVEWLRKSLSQIGANPAGGFTEQVFDEQMALAVKKFQLANGLQPDGMVGPQTLILLDAASKPEPPLLVWLK